MAQEQKDLDKGVNRRQLRMNLRRQEILKVAARLFADVGYERTTLEMIASELGLSQPALYYYVARKEDVLAQLFEDIIQRIIERTEEDISSVKSPDQQLRLLIKAHIASICHYPEGKAFILYESHLLSLRTPEILEKRDHYQQIVESILTAGIEQGIFSITNVKLATFALLGALNWIPRWFSTDGNLSPEVIGDFYAQLLVRALLASEVQP